MVAWDGTATGQSEEDEAESLAQFAALLQHSEQIEREYDRLSGQTPLRQSELARDNLLTDPLQLGHLVQYCLLQAADNLRAIRTLASAEAGFITLPVVALYPHLRTVIEASAQALWLLRPDAPAERILRLLQARAAELAYDTQMMKVLFGQTADRTPAQVSTGQRELRRYAKERKTKRGYLSAIASLNGTPRAAYDAGFPAWRDVILDASGSSRFARNAALLETMWMFASGLTHPSSSRALIATSLESIGEPVGNIHSARMTANLAPLVPGLWVALGLFEDACKLWRFRMTKVAQR